MNKRILLTLVLANLIVVLTACGEGPTIPVVAGLDAETLERLDAINRTIDEGIDIGPDTRELIKEVNQTISNAKVKGGFDKETLDRIDRLLTAIEEGPEFGFTSETRAEIERLLNMLDQAPYDWQEVGTELIKALENSSAVVADRMAEDMKGVIQEARKNMEAVITTGAIVTGEAFRCNVDFVSDRANEQVEAFIGRSIVGRLRAIWRREDIEAPVPIPWVCHRIPDRIDLIREGDSYFVSQEDKIVKFVGYNFYTSNLPELQIVAEDGPKVDFERIYPYLGSSYEIEFSLGGKDFKDVPEGARIVFTWPNTPNTNAIGIVFPQEKPVPELEIIKDDVLIYKGPSTYYWPTDWRAPKGAKYEVRGQFGTWWKIKDNQSQAEGWVSDDVVKRNDVPAPPIAAPSLPPSAEFECTQTQGYKPLNVTCAATKTAGDPNGWEWLWDFGDGSEKQSGTPATHEYQKDGSFTVTLEFSNNDGWGIITSIPNYITVNVLPPPPQASFTASPTEGEAPLEVKFTNTTEGNLTYWEWYFEDNATYSSTDPGASPQQRTTSYIFNSPNTYVVTLEVHGEHGQKSEWTESITVKEPAKVYPNSMFFVRYRGLSSRYFDASPNDDVERIHYNTGFNDQDFKCGIVGFRVHGNIPDPSGGIYADVANMDAYLEADVSGDWWINASLEVKYRTKSDQYQSWDIDMLCIHNNVFDRGGAEYIPFEIGFSGTNIRALEFNPETKEYTGDTGILVNNYHCGVVGFSFKDAVYTPNPPYVFKAHAIEEENEENWVVHTRFQDLSIPLEEPAVWTRVNVLCLTKDSDIDIQLIQASLPNEEPGYYLRPIGLTSENYRCGVFGMSVEGGRLGTSGGYRHNLIVAQVSRSGVNVWAVWAQFPSVSKKYNEDWLLDLFCLSNEYVLSDFTYDCTDGSCGPK